MLKAHLHQSRAKNSTPFFPRTSTIPYTTKTLSKQHLVIIPKKRRYIAFAPAQSTLSDPPRPAHTMKILLPNSREQTSRENMNKRPSFPRYFPPGGGKSRKNRVVYDGALSAGSREQKRRGPFKEGRSSLDKRHLDDPPPPDPRGGGGGGGAEKNLVAPTGEESLGSRSVANNVTRRDFLRRPVKMRARDAWNPTGSRGAKKRPGNGRRRFSRDIFCSFVAIWRLREKGGGLNLLKSKFVSLSQKYQEL